jgi:hypothetical protein
MDLVMGGSEDSASGIAGSRGSQTVSQLGHFLCVFQNVDHVETSSSHRSIWSSKEALSLKCNILLSG